MSQYFSRQYLSAKQRAVTAPKRIEADFGCPGCGYNLRGIDFGSRCPECGLVIELGPVFDDMLSAGSWSTRNAWRLGLGTLFLCLLAFVTARTVLYLSAFGGAAGALQMPYVVGLLVLSIVWMVACWAVTPLELGKRFIILGHLRYVVRLTQMLWPVALAMWLVGTTRQTPSLVEWAHLLWLVAGAGVLVLVMILCRVAVWAELEQPAARLHAVAWVLPITTLLVEVFPKHAAWFTLVLMGLFLGLWIWVMLVFAFAVLELQRHVSWAMAEARDRPLRPGRIAEARRRKERAVEARVRPIGPDLDDLPLDPPADAVRGAVDDTRSGRVGYDDSP